MQTIFEKYPTLKRVLKRKHLRLTVQLLMAVVLLFAAWEFANFVSYIRSYVNLGTVPSRPPVAEGFLPVAAFVAFKAWLLTKQIDPIHPAGLIIFMATVLTAWLFRRALCSWICPFGTLSEFLNRLGRKLIKRSIILPKWLDYPLLGLKYFIFYKIFSIFLQMSSFDAMQFMQIPYYSISDIKMFDFFANLAGKWILVIVAIILLTTFIKSFWCRYLCPYGALLGILGLFSPILLVRDKELCINCDQCNKACPNVVDVAHKKFVVTPECTGCTSCVNHCPKAGALQFKLLGFIPLNTLTYSLAFLGVFFGIIVWAQLSGHWETTLTISDYKALDSMMSGFSAGPDPSAGGPVGPGGPISQ